MPPHLSDAGSDAYAFWITAIPGSSLPSRYSREAPPPVEMWVILSPRPICCTAAALSPPPITVVATLSAIALATATGYAKALELPGDNYGFIPSIGMVVGYICGATLIPKYLSQATAMKICAIIAIIGSALVATMPAEYSVYCIFFMALGCSLMWPALWPLAMADLGKFTKAGSSLLTMAIAGGAVMPWVRVVVQDATSFQTSYWICVPCFLFILYYGMIGYKIRTKK